MKPEKIKDQLFWKFDNPMQGDYDEFTKLAIKPNQLFTSLLLAQTLLLPNQRVAPPPLDSPKVIDSPGLRECARCKQKKPISEFKRRSPSSKYYKSYCQQCELDYHDKYRAKFPKKLLPKDEIAKIVKEIIK